MQMQLVPRVIDESEPCLRCVMHPMMFSERKQKLKREAILPAPQRKDVSLLRLKYTSLDFCISHGKKLSHENATFKCLAAIYLKDITNLNNESETECCPWAGIKVEIAYAPMHQGQYVLDKDVFVNDKNVELPMHADLLYNMINEGDVSTRMRKFATQLVKQMEVIYNEPSS